MFFACSNYCGFVIFFNFLNEKYEKSVILLKAKTPKNPPLSLSETALRWAGLEIILPVFFMITILS